MVKFQNIMKIIRRIQLFPQIPRKASRKCRRESAGLSVTNRDKTHALTLETDEHSWLKILAHPCDLQLATAQDLQTQKLRSQCPIAWRLLSQVDRGVVSFFYSIHTSLSIFIQKQLLMCNKKKKR